MIVLGIGACAILVLVLAAFHHFGYQDGYSRGRRDADNWWIGIEKGADQARQQIWREEPIRGQGQERAE